MTRDTGMRTPYERPGSAARNTPGPCPPADRGDTGPAHGSAAAALRVDQTRAAQRVGHRAVRRGGRLPRTTAAATAALALLRRTAAALPALTVAAGRLA